MHEGSGEIHLPPPHFVYYVDREYDSHCAIKLA
jgi:hypothetical protein